MPIQFSIRNRNVKLWFERHDAASVQIRYAPTANYSSQNQQIYRSLGRLWHLGPMFIDRLYSMTDPAHATTRSICSSSPPPPVLHIPQYDICRYTLASAAHILLLTSQALNLTGVVRDSKGSSSGRLKVDGTSRRCMRADCGRERLPKQIKDRRPRNRPAPEMKRCGISVHCVQPSFAHQRELQCRRVVSTRQGYALASSAALHIISLDLKNSFVRKAGYNHISLWRTVRRYEPTRRRKDHGRGGLSDPPPFATSAF